MPFNFSNLTNLNYKKFIVKNETSGVFYIGDLKLKLNKGSSVDLLKPPIKQVQKRKYTSEDISNSRDLKLALKGGYVSIYTEYGKIEEFVDSIQSTNIATDYQVKTDVDQVKVEIEETSFSVKQYSFKINTDNDLTSKVSKSLLISNKENIPDWLSLVEGKKIFFVNSGNYDVSYSVPFDPYVGGSRVVWVAKNGEYPLIIDGGINKAIEKLTSSDNLASECSFTIPIGEAISGVLDNKDVTFEFWYKPTNFGSAASITAASKPGMIFSHWSFYAGTYQRSDGRIACTSSRSDLIMFDDMTPLELGVWQHIAITLKFIGNNLEAKIYVNGILSSTKTKVNASKDRDSVAPLINLSWGNHGFAIDNFVISDTIRYTENFTPPISLSVDGNTVCAYECQIVSGIGEYNITDAIVSAGGLTLEDLSSNGKDLNLYRKSGVTASSKDKYRVISGFPIDTDLERYAESSLSSNSNSQSMVVTGNDTISINAGDYIEIYAYQDSGFTLSTNSSSAGRFIIKHIG